MSWSDQVVREEEKARGVAVRLEVEGWSDLYYALKSPVAEKVSVRLGAPNQKEPWGEEVVKAVIHADAAVTIQTNRFATTIPLAELEALVKLAQAVRDKKLPVEEPPEGRVGPFEDVEVPF